MYKMPLTVCAYFVNILQILRRITKQASFLILSDYGWVILNKLRIIWRVPEWFDYNPDILHWKYSSNNWVPNNMNPSRMFRKRHIINNWWQAKWIFFYTIWTGWPRHVRLPIPHTDNVHAIQQHRSTRGEKHLPLAISFLEITHGPVIKSLAMLPVGLSY